MVIEKVHGLQATGMSLNDRFTMLAAAAPVPAPMRPRRRPSMGSSFSQNLNFKNRYLIEQIARRLEMQAKRQAVKQRLGALRRFGSESSLPGLWRSNSFGNLSQASQKSRNNWRQSNGNLSRSGSFNNLAAGVWRGLRRWGNAPRMLRGRLRGMGGRQLYGRINRTPQRGRRGRRIGGAGGRGGRGGARGGRGRGARGGAGGARGRAQPRGRGRGGRIQNPKPVPSREELDLQLDQYMAATKAALDKDLDNYMNNAMEQE